MVRLFECGHREITGVLTEHAINQEIPLGTAGPCTQCRGKDVLIDASGDLVPEPFQLEPDGRRAATETLTPAAVTR